jgi:hypothetical protein
VAEIRWKVRRDRKRDGSVFRLLLTLGVFLPAISESNIAGAVEPHDMTAKELLFACSSAHESNDYPVCLVFMTGFVAGARATLKTLPWCAPPNLTLEEEIPAFVRVMRTYPQLLSEPLPTAVGAALVTAYPCHGK